jgi:PAS domain S-box-containing protein
VIDSVPDGLRVIDQDYRVVQANQAFCQQVGRSMEEIIGQPCYALSHLRGEPCAATLVCCPLHELTAKEGPLVFRDHHHNVCGVETPVEVAAARFVSGDRALVVEVIRDLAQEMKFSQEQKLSELGLLAAGVAHEIRNPLSSIHLSINAIEKVLGQSASKEALNDIMIIDKEIDRCIEVTDRLLKLTMTDTVGSDLIEIDRLVHEVMSLLRYEATQLGISVEIDIDRGLRLVGSDGDMRMIVLNLAQNAIHALPKGGCFKIAGRSLEHSIELTFEDNGVGIPPEDMPYIFHPFWSRRADDVRGTGLGLSICKAIVKSHGGKISAESEFGGGTRFLVTLPNADTKETAA